MCKETAEEGRRWSYEVQTIGNPREEKTTEDKEPHGLWVYQNRTRQYFDIRWMDELTGKQRNTDTEDFNTFQTSSSSTYGNKQENPRNTGRKYAV